MRIGFVGLGKLGLPCALAASTKGHDVMGHDILPELMTKKPRSVKELGPDGRTNFNTCLERSNLRFGRLEDIVAHADILFVTVQTPHEQEYEGVTRVPADRIDFDYRYLIQAIEEVASHAPRKTIVAIVSTVLRALSADMSSR